MGSSSTFNGDYILTEFEKIIQTRTYTSIVFRTTEKSFAIFVEPHVGKTIQSLLGQEEPRRPATFHLIASVFEGFRIRIKQVLLQDVEDDIYIARLFVEQEVDGLRHILEVDARPSDSIILALLHRAPIYSSHTVLKKSISYQE